MTLTENALYRMLALRPAGDPNPDGTDVLREALDDTQFLRDCVKQMLGDLHAGKLDNTELGRMVWARVEHYCMASPAFQDAVDYEHDEAGRPRMAGAL